MNATGFIDLHCDTLTYGNDRIAENFDRLNNPQRAISLSKIKPGTKWAQFFAIFIPDDYRGKEAIKYFEYYCKIFYRQMDKFSNITTTCRTCEDIEEAFKDKEFASILTVEGGAVLAGQLNRIKMLADAGVKSLTLVWNGENELASGHSTNKGLTSLGKDAIVELEN